MTFKKGDPGGPGRPKRSTEEKYLKKLQSSTSLKEWREIIVRAVEDAKRGDSRARQWLSDYLLGKPRQSVAMDVTTGGDKLTIEYINNWRDNTSESSHGTEDSTPTSEKV